MMMDDDDDVVTFNAKVAKLCVARWKPWSWTCAFCPTKHSVFDVRTCRRRRRGQTEGFARNITIDYTIITIITIIIMILTIMLILIILIIIYSIVIIIIINISYILLFN